jgi:predicted nucleic acid-binding protein
VAKPAGVDTNVLVYAEDDSSPHQAACRALLKDRRRDLYLAPQVLSEFYSVATKAGGKRITNPLSPEEALSAIATFLAQPNIDLLPVPADIVSRWTELARRHPVTGAKIFDLQLAAVLLANNITRLCTFNIRDFEMISELDVGRP